MVNPLPDLRPGDFDGGGIFHQVVDGNAASTAQPRFQVLQTDADVVAQACFGDLSPRDGQEVAGRHMYIFTLPIYLVGSLHDFVKFLHGDLYQAWMCYPGAIMTIGGFTPLVGAHTLQRLFVGLRIVLDGDLGSHAANGVDEHGGANGAPGDAQFLLGKHKYVIPEAGFQVVLQLGQVEIGSGALREQRFHIVEEVKGEVEDAARNRLAIDEDVLFRQVPSARAHQQGRGFFL